MWRPRYALVALVLSSLLLLPATRARCDDEDPFSFLKDGSLERGEDPDPEKVLGIMVKVKVVRVKRTITGTAAIPEAAPASTPAALTKALAGVSGPSGNSGAGRAPAAESDSSPAAGGASSVSFGASAPPRAATKPLAPPPGVDTLPVIAPLPVLTPAKL